jgi:histidine triad (HIT) family protein
MPEQQLNEEQIKALQEKLKQMSPEELKEFQKKQCIFCQIISGKVQSRKIYEDENAIAVLDINPSNPGHILIMPREHYSIMPQMPDDEVSHIFLVAKHLSNACLRALEAEGSNIIVANGITAGQRAQHFMVHLIPRKENDKLKFDVPQKNIPEGELQKIGKMLSKILGTKAAEPVQVPPVPTIPKKHVVEAEFKEEKITAKKKSSGKNHPRPKRTKPKVKKQTAKKSKRHEPKKHESAKQESTNLDDIARVLGVK